MRIIHLAAGAGSMYCGACARDLAMVRGLMALGHEVLVVPLYTPLRDERGGHLPLAHIQLGGISAWLQQVSPMFRKMPAALERLLDSGPLLSVAARLAVSTRPETLGPMTASVLAGAEGRQAAALRLLLRFLENQPRPDVVSITNSLLAGIAPEVRRVLGVPIVCGLQGEDAFVDAMPERWRAEVDRLMRLNARSVDVFVAPSAAYAERMAAFLDIERSRIAVVRPGIDPGPYRSIGHHSAEPVVGYLSAIRPEKGLDLLVEAFAVVARRLPAARLLVAGRVLHAAYWRRVRQRIRAADIVDRVRYMGEVSFEDKLAFLRQCALFSVPSRIAESRGMAVLEAMAAGVPAVVPESGVYPEVAALTGGAVLFPVGDVDALAARLLGLLDQPSEARVMGARAAVGVAAQFDAGAKAAEMAAVFADVVGRAPNGRPVPAVE